VTAFRTRRLDHTGFPYVYLDATYLHVRNSTSQVVSMAVVVATGITTDGGREVLGLDVGDSEDELFWRDFLTALKRRGLSGCGWSSPTSTPTWSQPCSAPSSFNPTGRRPVPEDRHLWTTRRPRCSRSPRSPVRTGPNLEHQPAGAS
jgi:hypothetical protein